MKCLSSSLGFSENSSAGAWQMSPCQPAPAPMQWTGTEKSGSSIATSPHVCLFFFFVLSTNRDVTHPSDEAIQCFRQQVWTGGGCLSSWPSVRGGSADTVCGRLPGGAAGAHRPPRQGHVEIFSRCCTSRQKGGAREAPISSDAREHLGILQLWSVLTSPETLW